jgi:hypothetical protein
VSSETLVNIAFTKIKKNIKNKNIFHAKGCNTMNKNKNQKTSFVYKNG